jgi:hypothetical protein
MRKKPFTDGPATNAKDFIAIQSQDEEGFHVAARMAPNILETTPAVPALSEEQINEQRWQHLRKELQAMESCDKEGHTALMKDQIVDHRIAEKLLPTVLDKVRSTTPGKAKVAEAFIPGGARLNLVGRGLSRSSVDKSKAGAAKVRKAVKKIFGTPIFRAILNAKTPGTSSRKPPRRENTTSAPNFDLDLAANAPRTTRTPLETNTNIPIPGTLHPNTPVPETPVAQQDTTPSNSPSRQEPDDTSFEARMYAPTSPEARTPSCEQSCCSPYDRRNTTATKRRRVSFSRVAYCSPVAEEASSESMMLDETPPASRILARSPEPAKSSKSNPDPIVDVVDDNSTAYASNDTDPIVADTVLEEEDEEYEEASSDSMMVDETPPASLSPARSPGPSESDSGPMTNGMSPASSSNDTDPIVVETVLEEEDEEYEEASSDSMMVDETPPASLSPARSPGPSESDSGPMTNGMSPASSSNDTDPIVVETVLEEEDEEYEEASSDSMMLDETPPASLFPARSPEPSESNSDPTTNGMSPASSSNDTDPIVVETVLEEEDEEYDLIGMSPSMGHPNVSDSWAASDPTPVATRLPRSPPRSPPKDGRQPNRSAHLPVVQSPPRRTKRRQAKLTFEKKQELCKRDLGEQTIDHLSKNKDTFKAKDRRPFLAAVAHHDKKVIEKVVGVKINAQEYKNIRIHAKYPGKFVEARKPRVFRNKINKDLLLKLLHHLDDPGNLQRLAVGRQLVEIMSGQKCVELDNVTRNKTCATLAAEFIVKLGEEMDTLVMAEDGTPLPESADRCQCLEKGTGRRCMKVCGHDKRPEKGSGEEDETDPKHYRHKYTPPGSISFTTAMELIGTLTGEDLKALSGLDDIKVAKGMENFKREREISALYFSGARKDQMKQRIDNDELFYQTDFVPHLKKVSENNCNCLTCGFCDESKSCVNCYKSQLKSLGPPPTAV